MSQFDPYRLRARARAAHAVVGAIFLVLGAAFFRLQILQHDRYRLRSENNRLREVALAAARGAILDRHGAVIAENAPGYVVKLFAPSVDSLRAVLARFQRIVPLDTGTVRLVLARYRAVPYQPATVMASSSFETIARLEEHRMSLPGLVIQTEPRRRYPAGPAVGHVAGYVGEVTEGDLAANRFPGAVMGTLVGRSGIEAAYDSILRGRPGARFIEVNAQGRLVREEASTPPLRPTPGTAVTTTIDLALQTYVDSLWQATFPGLRGALVAMEPNGAVLAMYSAPSFDPNDFVGGISSARYAELTSESAGKPLLNRAIQGTYPPASPFKLAIAAMALRRGLVTMASHMEQPCTGGFRFGNRTFRCWKREGHGSLDLAGAITASCDVYFYQLGLRLGLGPLLEDGMAMGFHEPSGIDLGGEVESFFPPSTGYYDRWYGPRGWTRAVTLNLAIGQGEITQSLMNMMRFYQALATDGRAGPPYLVARRPSAQRHLDLSPRILLGLREAMKAVVARGTAAASKGLDLQVAGKTGTAQNPHGKDHGWFIGFAPADEPKILVGAIVEEGLHGSTVAPAVVKVIRRFLVPTEGDRGPEPRLLFPADSAPRSIFLDLDTLRRRAGVP